MVLVLIMDKIAWPMVNRNLYTENMRLDKYLNKKGSSRKVEE